MHVGTLSSWFDAFNGFVAMGGCSPVCGAGCMNAGGVVPNSAMPACLLQYLSSAGLPFANNLVIFNSNGTAVTTVRHSLSVFFTRKPASSLD